MADTRVALVTGGSRGIGAEITRQLVARRLNVVYTYRSGRREAAALAAELGPSACPAHFDLGDAASAEALVEAALSRWGRLDSLVLNAGMWQGGRLERVNPAVWASVIETNVVGSAQVARAALPALCGGDTASITVVSSAVGIVGFSGDTAYASAKAALVGFARSLAKEVARDGVRVNVLAPGFVATDMTAEIPERSRERILDDLVLRRPGTAQEVATAAVFLAEDATYCTGTVLSVDGGWTL